MRKTIATVVAGVCVLAMTMGASAAQASGDGEAKTTHRHTAKQHKSGPKAPAKQHKRHTRRHTA